MSKLTDKETVEYAYMKFYDDALIVKWGITNIGFGEFIFERDNDGNTIIDSEAMDKDTIRKVMNHIIDKAKLKDGGE
jgi:hypothetical protein